MVKDPYVPDVSKCCFVYSTVREAWISAGDLGGGGAGIVG